MEGPRGRRRGLPLHGPAGAALGLDGRPPVHVHYTAFYNLLDAPAGTLPVTYATEADDAELVSSYPGEIRGTRRLSPRRRAPAPRAWPSACK